MAHSRTSPGALECAICQNAIGQTNDEGESEVAITTPCGHVFGEICLKLWLKTANTCPLCRTELTELKHNLIVGVDTFFQHFDRTLTAALAKLDHPLPRRVRSLDPHNGNRHSWIREIDWHLRSLAVNYHNPRITFLEDAIGVAAMRLERGKPVEEVLSALSRELHAEVLIHGVAEARDADDERSRAHPAQPGRHNPRSRT